MAHKDGFVPTVSFVIPVYNQARMTVSCFASIRASISCPYEIIWIDNGSNEVEFGTIKVQATRPRVHTKLVRFEKNIGFVKATNAGIREAEGEYVILLNNDTEVGFKLATRLIYPLTQDKTVGATGPVTDSSIGWQGIRNINRRWSLSYPSYDGNIKEYSRVIREAYPGKCIPVGGRKLPLSFFCCCMRRSLFDEIGYLDEDFGIGLGDDDDMAMRMAAFGYKQMLVLDAFCRHHHRTTFTSLKLGVDSLRRHAIRVLKKKSKEYDKMQRERKEENIIQTN
jgi:GT2 family glycosyltransferase